MRIFIFLLLSMAVWAGKSDDTEVRMWSRLILDVKLNEYRIFTHDPEMKKLLGKIDSVEIVDSCTDATLAIESRKYPVVEKNCEKIPKISSDYRLFLKDNDAIGVFFWLKSRPTILFSRQRLEKFGIDIAEEMKEYVESLP